MPVQHSKLEMHKVERILRRRNFGFIQHQGGFFQLNKPSTKAFRADGTPHRDALPGFISPQVQERVLTFARSEDDAAAQFVALATQEITDPVLADEPASAPPLDMDAIERVTGTIVENKLADVVKGIEDRNKKMLDAVLSAIAPLSKRLDALEGGDEPEPPTAAVPAPKSPKPRGGGKAKVAKPANGKKAKGSWRKKPAPEAPAPAVAPVPLATGRPPAPPMDMGIG